MSATFKYNQWRTAMHFYRQQVFCTAKFVKYGGGFRHLVILIVLNVRYVNCTQTQINMTQTQKSADSYSLIFIMFL